MARNRPKDQAEVLTGLRERGKVIEKPTRKQVEANPGARGYDENGGVLPADDRAAFLVVPEPEPEPT